MPPYSVIRLAIFAGAPRKFLARRQQPHWNSGEDGVVRSTATASAIVSDSIQSNSATRVFSEPMLWSIASARRGRAGMRYFSLNTRSSACTHRQQVDQRHATARLVVGLLTSVSQGLSRGKSIRPARTSNPSNGLDYQVFDRDHDSADLAWSSNCHRKFAGSASVRVVRFSDWQRGNLRTNRRRRDRDSSY